MQTFYPFRPLTGDFVEVQPRRGIWIVFLIVSLTVLIGCSIVYRYEVQQEEELLAEVNRLNSQIESDQRAQAARPATPEEEKRRLDAAAADAAIHYPWDAVFANVEFAADVEGVALLSMTHDRESRKTSLTVESLDVPALLLYLEKLNEGAERPDAWTLLGYQLQQRGFPQTIKAQVETTQDVAPR